jgi:hypothetical protein
MVHWYGERSASVFGPTSPLLDIVPMNRKRMITGRLNKNITYIRGVYTLKLVSYGGGLSKHDIIA